MPHAACFYAQSGRVARLSTIHSHPLLSSIYACILQEPITDVCVDSHAKSACTWIIHIGITCGNPGKKKRLFKGFDEQFLSGYENTFLLKNYFYLRFLFNFNFSFNFFPIQNRRGDCFENDSL
jgi:hypothetical protein